jgi:light-regulated signal transduction histidine kinase (bacteriophytochrome)
MAATIDDLLRLTGISREPLHRQQIDLSLIAKTVIHELRHTEPQRKVAIEIARTLPAFADNRLMTIALSNIIGNAWKYSSKNQDARIEVGILSAKNGNTFFVRDNGAGFDMRFVEKIFQPFQRLHSESQFPGTGIGLAIVQKIIHRHGGKIWAESEIGKGATFYFTLDSSGQVTF